MWVGQDPTQSCWWDVHDSTRKFGRDTMWEGSSEIPLRILDWISGTPLGTGGIWPPIFTCGTKEKMFFDSLLLTASVGSMFTFLVYDFMNIKILWRFFCQYYKQLAVSF